jgi:hypothetical protein
VFKSRGKSTFKKELALCLVLILMGFLDWLTTFVGVLFFGAVETNSLFAGLVSSNTLVFSAIKLATAVLVGFLFYRGYAIQRTLGISSHLGKRFLESGYVVSLMALTVVVTNNILTVVRIL